MQQNKTWPLIVTIVAAIAAFILGPIFWPMNPGNPEPTSVQLPLFIGVGVMEAVGFGIGVAFLIFGWRFMRNRTLGDWLAFLSAAWLLVSWWPHDRLHMMLDHGDYWGLLGLEWGFHVTLILCGVILASFLWKRFSATV